MSVEGGKGRGRYDSGKFDYSSSVVTKLAKFRYVTVCVSAGANFTCVYNLSRGR